MCNKRIDFRDIKIDKIFSSKGKCCFCGEIFFGMGNSTRPIYYELDGEMNRCCDKCNEEYVVAARKDKTLIMGIREKFGIK